MSVSREEAEKALGLVKATLEQLRTVEERYGEGALGPFHQRLNAMRIEIERNQVSGALGGMGRAITDSWDWDDPLGQAIIAAEQAYKRLGGGNSAADDPAADDYFLESVPDGIANAINDVLGIVCSGQDGYEVLTDTFGSDVNGSCFKSFTDEHCKKMAASITAWFELEEPVTQAQGREIIERAIRQWGENDG